MKKKTSVKVRIPLGVCLKLRTAGGPHTTKKGKRGYQRNKAKQIDHNP